MTKRAALSISILVGLMAGCGGSDGSEDADQTAELQAQVEELQAENEELLTAATDGEDEQSSGSDGLEPSESAAPPETDAPETTTSSTSTSTTTSTTTTTLPGRDGSRDNPYDLRADAEDGPDTLSTDALSSMLLFAPQDVDFGRIQEANQFNDPPLPGMKYVDTLVMFTLDEAYSGTISGRDAARLCDLVGSKNKVYSRARVSDVPGILGLASDQPDVIGGGTIGGSVIYMVDADDGDWKLLCGGETFVIPAARS